MTELNINQKFTLEQMEKIESFLKQFEGKKIDKVYLRPLSMVPEEHLGLFQSLPMLCVEVGEQAFCLNLERLFLFPTMSSGSKNL